MSRILPFILICFFLFRPIDSNPATKSEQHTKGNQSPIVNVEREGKSTINYYGVTDRISPTIVPEIKCRLEYPYIKEKGLVRRKIENPQVVITNMGPIKAVSFSVDHKYYLYDIMSEKIVSEFQLFKRSNDHLIFVKEIQPAEDIKEELNGISRKGMIGIYVFTLRYYRESDMQLFTRQDFFFVDNNEIFSETDYKNVSHYPSIIKAMNKYKPDANSKKVCLLGIDENTWVTEATPKTGIFIVDEKGLIIADESADPETIIREVNLCKDRPLLLARPWKIKESGNYIDSEIISNDTVNVNLAFQVENIGDKEAINILEGDKDSYNKSLKPGEKIYYRKQLVLSRKKGDKQTSQELLKQEYVLIFGTTISYSDSVDDKKYQIEFLYRIGKSNVKLVKYSVR